MGSIWGRQHQRLFAPRARQWHWIKGGGEDEVRGLADMHSSPFFHHSAVRAGDTEGISMEAKSEISLPFSCSLAW